jgi:hypothetical protein
MKCKPNPTIYSTGIRMLKIVNTGAHVAAVPVTPKVLLVAAMYAMPIGVMMTARKKPTAE